MIENKKFIQLKTDYDIPKMLQDAINALQEGVENNVSFIDCLQDEVHSCARELDDEKEKEIINYYVNRSCKIMALIEYLLKLHYPTCCNCKQNTNILLAQI